MKNDYLWDGSGEPDPELQRIEKSLARFRYDSETRELLGDTHHIVTRIMLRRSLRRRQSA